MSDELRALARERWGLWLWSQLSERKKKLLTEYEGELQEAHHG